ncbi:MAG: cytochrome c oxidase assembly protein [Acidimicrobiales bacterium]
MSTGPFAFEAHAGAWAAVVALAVLLVVVLRRAQRPDAPGGPVRATRRQHWQLAGGLACLAVAVTWPVADLAAHWSLTALLVQRLLLTLVVAPLLLLSMPVPVLGRLTRPAPVDRAVEALSRAPIAIVAFTVIVVGSLSVPAVAAQASSWAWRAFFDSLLVLAGVILWVPALGHLPGARKMSPVGRAAYLVVQSVLPNFPAVIFVFARHPFYAAFAHAHRAIGLSPLNDQQLAGVVAKIGTLPVLWTVAWISLSRAQQAEELGIENETLTWAEVERALERTERAQRRSRH